MKMRVSIPLLVSLAHVVHIIRAIKQAETDHGGHDRVATPKLSAQDCKTLAQSASTNAADKGEDNIKRVCQGKIGFDRCDFLAESMSVAANMASFDGASFCDRFLSAIDTSRLMDNVLISEAVQDMAFGRCMVQIGKSSFCQKFHNTIAAAVKEKEFDTLRASYMMRLSQEPVDLAEQKKLEAETTDVIQESGPISKPGTVKPIQSAGSDVKETTLNLVTVDKIKSAHENANAGLGTDKIPATVASKIALTNNSGDAGVDLKKESHNEGREKTSEGKNQSLNTNAVPAPIKAADSEVSAIKNAPSSSKTAHLAEKEIPAMTQLMNQQEGVKLKALPVSAGTGIEGNAPQSSRPAMPPRQHQEHQVAHVPVSKGKVVPHTGFLHFQDAIADLRRESEKNANLLEERRKLAKQQEVARRIQQKKMQEMLAAKSMKRLKTTTGQSATQAQQNTGKSDASKKKQQGQGITSAVSSSKTNFKGFLSSFVDDPAPTSKNP